MKVSETLNQTWQKCSGWSYTRFVFLVLIGNPTYIMCSEDSTKPINCGFAGMIIGWSCTKLVNRLPEIQDGTMTRNFNIGPYGKNV